MLVEATTNFGWQLAAIMFSCFVVVMLLAYLGGSRLWDFREYFLEDSYIPGSMHRPMKKSFYDGTYKEFSGSHRVKYSYKQLKIFSVIAGITPLVLFNAAFIYVIFAPVWDVVPVDEQFENYYGVELSENDSLSGLSRGQSLYVDEIAVADSNEFIENAVIARSADENSFTLFSVGGDGELVEADQVNPMIEIAPFNFVKILPA